MYIGIRILLETRIKTEHIKSTTLVIHQGKKFKDWSPSASWWEWEIHNVLINRFKDVICVNNKNWSSDLQKDEGRREKWEITYLNFLIGTPKKTIKLIFIHKKNICDHNINLYSKNLEVQILCIQGSNIYVLLTYNLASNADILFLLLHFKGSQKVIMWLENINVIL